MFKKNLIVILWLLLLAGCTTCKGVKTAPGGGEPPIILDSYAAKSIRPGVSWRVYLRTQDVDGDIRDIVAVLWQSGVGYYSTDITPVKGADQKDFAGYLFLNTPADSTLLWDEFKLTVLVRDCQGNKSEPINFPLRFDYGAKEELPGEWQMSANHQLGAIMIDIQSSSRYNSGNGAIRDR
jgi:hypothetical protein